MAVKTTASVTTEAHSPSMVGVSKPCTQGCIHLLHGINGRDGQVQAAGPGPRPEGGLGCAPHGVDAEALHYEPPGPAFAPWQPFPALDALVKGLIPGVNMPWVQAVDRVVRLAELTQLVHDLAPF